MPLWFSTSEHMDCWQSSLQGQGTIVELRNCLGLIVQWSLWMTEIDCPRICPEWCDHLAGRGYSLHEHCATLVRQVQQWGRQWQWLDRQCWYGYRISQWCAMISYTMRCQLVLRYDQLCKDNRHWCAVWSRCKWQMRHCLVDMPAMEHRLVDMPNDEIGSENGLMTRWKALATNRLCRFWLSKRPDVKGMTRLM
jgi:hypothetical protein